MSVATGPCSDWITGVDVAACCDVDDCDQPTLFNDVATVAQEILFELSGRRFAGECEQTVRPCRTRCGWPFQVLSRGHIVWSNFGWGWAPDGYWGWDNGTPCGCRHLSTVHLAGYPVQEILEVKIGGDIVDPATYRLDRHRNLVRVRDTADPGTMLLWPACQTMDLPDTEPGTFSVTYSYGQDPPAAGVSAATQLACELYKACSGQACALPKGTVRYARQGVIVDKQAVMDFVFVPTKLATRGARTSGWRTGMALVDAFLNAYNATGLIRRPIFWSPASALQYPLPVTEAGS